MRDEDNRRAGRLPHLQQIVIELETRDPIERGERLVHQEELRLGDERARNRDPHAHAAGQFARKGLREFAETDTVERRPDSLRNARRRHAFKHERQRYIVGHAGPGHQRRVLEDKANTV